MSHFKTIGLRFLFTVLFWSLTQAVVFQHNASAAARACRVVFEVEKPEVKLLEILGREDLNVSGELLKKVNALFLKEGIELQTKNLVEALEGAGEVLRDGNTDPSSDLADKMSKLGDKLLKLVKSKFNKDQNLMLSYYVAESVLKMERIPLKKFDTTEAKPKIFDDSGVLHIPDFHKYVESYVDGTSLYKNLNSSAGIIGMGEIRSLYSNNSWIIGFKDHDIYHLHYSYGHPFYLAINFMTSRSINNKRYTMISSFWESIDSTQYGYESAISKYFKAKNMSPQEGMIFLARASDADLTKIENELTSSYGYMSQVEYGPNSTWKPHLIKFGRQKFAKNYEIYDDEIANFINKSLQLMKDPTKKKYSNYYRLSANETPETDHDICVHY